MKKEIKLLIVCSVDDVSKLKQCLTNQGTDIIIKYEANDYKKALEIINNSKNEIDAILVDGTLEGQNVLELLTNYKDKWLLQRTIIIDNIKLDCYNLTNSMYQIYNIIPKNYKISDLVLFLNEISEKNQTYNFKKMDIYDKISCILKKLGIAPDKNGFHYLRKAIYECYKDPTLLTSITKRIYPLVSKTFDKKESCIERSMRSAIETGWDRGNYEYTAELFANCLDYYKSKHTNGEFVAIIVDKLLLEDGKVTY